MFNNYPKLNNEDYDQQIETYKDYTNYVLGKDPEMQERIPINSGNYGNNLFSAAKDGAHIG